MTVLSNLLGFTFRTITHVFPQINFIVFVELNLNIAFKKAVVEKIFDEALTGNSHDNSVTKSWQTSRFQATFTNFILHYAFAGRATEL